MTEEFYQLVDKKLTKDGMVISNFIGALEEENSKLFQSTYKTMNGVFPKVYIFPSNVNNVDHRQNITILGLKGESINKFERILKNNFECSIPELDCEKFFKNFYSGIFDDNTPTLTDQFSPVNRLGNLEESSYIYNEIKSDRINLQGGVAEDSLVQIGLILSIVVWIYPLQNVWRKNTKNN